MSGLNASCERCGRRIEVKASRPQPPVRCCRDCKYSDPEYLRLRAVSERHNQGEAA